jgi:signal transduction histidine kinase
MKYTEDDILTRRVEMETRYFVNQYLEDKQTAKLPNSIGLYGYLSTSPDVPQWLQEQSPGIRELHDREVHVGVSRLPNSNELLYVVLSESESSSLEQIQSALLFSLLSVGLLITFIGMGIGVLVGRYITAPLMQLTAQVEGFNSSSLGHEDIVSFHGADRTDEVGALSRSFSLLVTRLDEFLLREKQFTRFASHELRTPLTVIRTALAVLRLPQSSSESRQRNLDRVENAAIEMEGLIDTFLYLGREQQTLLSKPLSADEILIKSIQKHSYINANKHLQLSTDIQPNTVIYNDSKLLEILFDNIIRNMFLHGKSLVKITLDQKGLLVENDIDLDHHEKTTPYDSYGLGIIRRLSQYCHLETLIQNDKNHFTVSVLFHQA